MMWGILKDAANNSAGSDWRKPFSLAIFMFLSFCMFFWLLQHCLLFLLALLSFEWIKWNFTILASLLDYPCINPLLPPPWKKSFRRPWPCRRFTWKWRCSNFVGISCVLIQPDHSPRHPWNHDNQLRDFLFYLSVWDDTDKAFITWQPIKIPD